MRRPRPGGSPRIRGTNRNAGGGAHFETVTLVAHDGRPVASRCVFEEGGEAAATAALLEDVDVGGRMVTLDALHTSFDMERRVVDVHGADYLFAVKANCPETFAVLAALDWDAPGVRRHETPPEKAHGRIEQRTVAALDLPKGMLNFRHARQAFRVRRQRAVVKTGRTTEETACGICSGAAEQAGPERLLAWNRGHWMVENGNHHPRDASLGEDACRVRARNAPARKNGRRRCGNDPNAAENDRSRPASRTRLLNRHLARCRTMPRSLA